PDIRQVKKPVRQDGLLCVCGNCKNVGLISAAPSGNRHRRMAASPYPAHSNYSAYEAGALVEPIRAQPTQSLTMNYSLYVLI
ncbi:hypothetical protein DN031_19365, partial [Salmonella enterica subsp. enterica]|nr:hypothetical protein [Salmonella enterica subsp. enterica serovar Kedougou]EAC1260237.1 hypothetical protein [Salmonella enterica subsp. enterica serovar Kedougou]EBX9149657.1 hypothetical protein [Salmonella enterica subsp. enterica serovar Kedougou]